MIISSMILTTEELVQNIDRQYLIDNNAVMKDSIEIIESKCFLNGKTFSGIVYSKYDNNQLESVESYKNGVLHGSIARWYENGQKQMEAIFRDGKLNGYFKGWFENGDLKYDLNFYEDSRREDALKEDEKDADPDDSIKE